MVDASNFFKQIKQHPDRFYIIHYSSQSLYDAGLGTLSPRITSVVIQHYANSQTVSFSTHTIAEYLKIPMDNIEEKYDEVERELLQRFYDFVRDRREKIWVHWNMRNVTFGFEHLEHRYRVLTGQNPPSIPVEVRINLNDVLKFQFGDGYAPDPRMLSLMNMNGGKAQGFLTGAEEAAAFEQKDFIRMHASTISKVNFFNQIISKSVKGKLITAASGIANFIDRMLSGRKARIFAAIATILGLITAFIQIIIWIIPYIQQITKQ